MKNTLASLVGVLIVFLVVNSSFADELKLTVELYKKVFPGINCILQNTGIQYASVGQLTFPDKDKSGEYFPQCNTAFFKESFSNNILNFTIDSKKENLVLHEIDGLTLTANPKLESGLIRGWEYGGVIAERFTLTGPGLLPVK